MTTTELAARIHDLMKLFPAMVAKANEADAGRMLNVQKHLAQAREVLLTSSWHLHRAIEELEEK